MILLQILDSQDDRSLNDSRPLGLTEVAQEIGDLATC